MRNNRNGSRPGNRRTARGRVSLPPKGGFMPGPSDPPPGSKDAWKTITLSIELQPGSVSFITTTLLGTELVNQGITPAALRLHSISAWSMPGGAANQTRPSVTLGVTDMTNKGSFGERIDYGGFSQNAHLHFAWPASHQQSSFSVVTGINVAQTLITGPAGLLNVRLSYLQ